MPDDLGKEVPVVLPKPEAPKPEIKAKFEDARRLGRQLFNIDGDRRVKGYPNFHEERIMIEFSKGLRDVPDAELSDAKVLDAQKASFGFTLGGAKQIKNGEMIKSHVMRDDPESLGALLKNMSDAVNFAEHLRNTNPDAFSEVAKVVVGSELGKKPEEVVIDGPELAKWVNETYSGARQRLMRQAGALSAYLGR